MTRLYRLMLATAAVFGVPSLALADGPASGEVTGVSVQASPGRADIVINVRGAVEVRDFMLESPNRLVLDVMGARLKGNSTTVYDGVKRGGVLNLRYSQFQSDVVRIVLELDHAKDYHVERGTDAIRVSFGTDQSFLAWSSNDPSQVIARTKSPRRAPEVQLPASRLTRSTAAEEPRITVVWDRANIADVVAGFAAFSGRTIILGKDIKGEVSAEIKNQPWPQAFQAVLASQGLSAQEMAGGIIRVDAPSVLAALDSLEPLETNVVRINYGKAKDLTKSIEGSLTKGRGKVIADDNSNSLIITDTRSKVANIADFVRGLDIRTPQVSIKAKIVFVDRTDIEELGIKYDLGNNNQFFNTLAQRPDPNGTPGDTYDPEVNIIDLGGNSVSGIGNASGTIVGSALDLVFSTALGGFTLTSFLSALERQDLSDIQAEPVITTLDNRKADILVGEETPVRVIDAGGNGTTATATVQFKETGIRLTVTPHVTANRQISMELHTERSAIQEVTAGDLGFVFQTQRADNQLLVNDGETAVIGGLTVTEVTNSRSGIPLLSGLPIVGKLFSFSKSEENRRDLIILVTPRIIDDGATPQ
ncbi:MAG TPA: secretin N-terminal domain-containing protein [Gemmatimonadales bacterium]|nr:secretin N-terminal domain-containing protein [Gemmatimonadales bacterium]